MTDNLRKRSKLIDVDSSSRTDTVDSSMVVVGLAEVGKPTAVKPHDVTRPTTAGGKRTHNQLGLQTDLPNEKTPRDDPPSVSNSPKIVSVKVLV